MEWGLRCLPLPPLPWEPASALGFPWSSALLRLQREVGATFFLVLACLPIYSLANKSCLVVLLL